MQQTRYPLALGIGGILVLVIRGCQGVVGSDHSGASLSEPSLAVHASALISW